MFVDIQTSEFQILSPDDWNDPCSGDVFCSKFGLYNPNKSTTVGSENVSRAELFYASYGTTTLDTDTVIIGGTEVKEVGLTYQSIGMDSCECVQLL